MDLSLLRRIEALPVCQPDPEVTPGAPSRQSVSYMDELTEEVLHANLPEGVVMRIAVARIRAATPTRDLTFTGNDASAGAVLALADTLVWFKQLHLEVIGVETDAHGSVDPGVLAHLMSVQGTLHACLRQAIDIHRRLHG
jgi:hypothetical protein